MIVNLYNCNQEYQRGAGTSYEKKLREICNEVKEKGPGFQDVKVVLYYANHHTEWTPTIDISFRDSPEEIMAGVDYLGALVRAVRKTEISKPFFDIVEANYDIRAKYLSGIHPPSSSKNDPVREPQ